MQSATGLRSAALRRLAFKAVRRQHATAARAAKTSVIRQIHQDLVSKQRSAAEVAQQYLDQITRADGLVNSFITVEAEHALQQARGWASRDCCQWLSQAACSVMAGAPVEPAAR